MVSNILYLTPPMPPTLNTYNLPRTNTKRHPGLFSAQMSFLAESDMQC